MAEAAGLGFGSSRQPAEVRFAVDKIAGVGKAPAGKGARVWHSLGYEKAEFQRKCG